MPPWVQIVGKSCGLFFFSPKRLVYFLDILRDGNGVRMVVAVNVDAVSNNGFYTMETRDGPFGMTASKGFTMAVRAFDGTTAKGWDGLAFFFFGRGLVSFRATFDLFETS
jgi:hypothetical protein